MSDRSTVTTIAAVGVALLLVGGLAGAGVGAVVAQTDSSTDNTTDSTPTEEPSSETENEPLEQELTLQDLRRGGEQFPGDDPSLRVEDERPFSVVHWPADRTFTNPGEDDQWRWLRPGGTVDRNAVWLRHFSVDGSEQLTLHIAYYAVGEERRTTDQGETVTEDVAKNLTVDSVTLDFDAGFPDQQEVTLRQSDSPRQVTMWIEGTDARWTFEHHSVATTRDLPFSSWGGFMQWAAVWWVSPMLLGVIGVNWGGKRMIERMGVFTQWGYAPWAVLFGITVGALALFASTWSARIFVEHPWIVPAVILFFTLILVLETLTDGVRRVRFVRDNIKARKNPSGDHAVEATMQDERELTLIDRPDQPIRAASPGLRPALARLAGGAAPVKAVDLDSEESDQSGEVHLRDAPLQTTKSVEDGHVDEEVYVNPESPKIVDHEPEGWTFDPPTPTSTSDLPRWLLGAGIVAAVTAVVFTLVGINAAIVTAAVIVGIAGFKPREGRLMVWPANYHYLAARASSKYLAEETDGYETIEEERAEKEKAKIKRQKEIKAAVDARDSTLVENMFTDPAEEVTAEAMVDPLEFDKETPAQRAAHEENGDEAQEAPHVNGHGGGEGGDS